MSQDVVNLLMEPARERVKLLCNHDLLPQLQSRFPLLKQRLYNSEPQTVTGVDFVPFICSLQLEQVV